MSLIPELSVSDYNTSLDFYTEVLCWDVLYARPEEGFAMLALGSTRLMIDQLGLGRDFDAGLTTTDRPFGRGVNLEITVAAISPLLAALAAAGHRLHLPEEEKWYRTGNDEIGQRQFIVADPDGYLLRFVEPLGRRALRGNDAL